MNLGKNLKLDESMIFFKIFQSLKNSITSLEFLKFGKFKFFFNNYRKALKALKFNIKALKKFKKKILNIFLFFTKIFSSKRKLSVNTIFI